MTTTRGPNPQERFTGTATDVTVRRDPARHRYDAFAGGPEIAGFVDYQETSELVVLTHASPRHVGADRR